MRNRKRVWTLMYKNDGRYKRWLYERLRRKEIAGREKHGWKRIDMR